MTLEEKSIKIPKDLHYKLKEIAFKNDVQIKKLVTAILEEAIKNEELIKKAVKKVKSTS